MIGYLEGTLRQLEATRALVMTSGVGYDIHISLQTYYRLEGRRDVSLEIYTHVREDALSLYGFATTQAKLAFERLISISGIGPTLAQKILSGIDAPDLADAIARGDARKLSTIPGVGKKTAERICLELRDKLVIPIDMKAAAPPTGRIAVEDDVQSALINLGYKAKDADVALRAARESVGDDADLSTLLKDALRQLTK
jgi:Holliday junction DNA helicase RuvA